MAGGRRVMKIYGIPEELIWRGQALGINVSMYSLVPAQKRAALLLKDVEREELLRNEAERENQRRAGDGG